jgi:hypothetical protein
MTAQELIKIASSRGIGLSVNGDKLRVFPACAVDDELKAALVANKARILQLLDTSVNDGAAHESAQRQVLAKLRADPGVKRAFYSRVEHGNIIITLAIRGIGTGELLIPAERFNKDSLDDYGALLACFDCKENA